MMTSGKRKTSFILLVITVMAATFLSGCHGSKGLKTFEKPQSFDENAKYEISFWAKNDTNKTQTAIYEEAIASFEKLYPNIKVNMRLYTDYGKIYNDVITNISTQTTPNVCITYPDHICTYISGANTVVPLDELMADEEYGLSGSKVKFDSPSYEEVIPKFLDECTISGVHYALPYMRSTEALYVNKTMLEKLGYTLPDVVSWDFIWEVSAKATEKNADGTYKINGQNVMIPFIYKSTDNMMIQMLKQSGGGYSDEEGNILIFNDDTKNILSTIAPYAKSGAFSTFKISSYPGNFLNAGQCIFAIDSTAGSTWMGCDAPLMDIAKDKIVKFETAVRPIPQFDTNNPKMISQGPSVCIFNKEDSGEVMASWLFTQYLLTNDVQIAYSKTEGYCPVTYKAQQSGEYTDYLERCGEDNTEHYDVKINATKLLIDNIDNTFVTPAFKGSTSLRDAAGQMIEDVCKSVRRKETVNEDYFKKEFDSVSSLYRLNSKSMVGLGAGSSEDVGELPVSSKILLISLAVIWVLIAIYAIRQALLKKRLSK